MVLKDIDVACTSQEDLTDHFEYKGLCLIAVGQLLQPIFLVPDLHAKPPIS